MFEKTIKPLKSKYNELRNIIYQPLIAQEKYCPVIRMNVKLGRYLYTAKIGEVAAQIPHM